MKWILGILVLLLVGCEEKKPMQFEEDAYFKAPQYEEMCERHPEAEVCQKN